MALVPEFLGWRPQVRVEREGWTRLSDLPLRRRGVVQQPTQIAETSVAEPAAETRLAARVPGAAQHAPTPPPCPPPQAGEGFERASASGAAHLDAAAALRDAPTPPEAGGLSAESRRHNGEARFICQTLRLFLICPRAACRRTRRCRGHPRFCLDVRGASAPEEAHAWAEALLDAGKTGESLADLEAAWAEEHAGFECWIAGIEARRE